MRDELVIALAQTDPTARDEAGRLLTLRRALAEAAAASADLVAFPALALEEAASVERLAEGAAGGPAVLVGAPWRAGDGRAFEAVFLLQGGTVAGKALRHAADPEAGFAAGPVPGPLGLLPARGGFVRLGALLAADLATEDVAEALGECGAEILVALGREPWAPGAAERRLQQAIARVAETGLPLLYVNAVGGAGGRVAEGGSLVLAADRRLVLQAPMLEAAVTICRWHRGEDGGWRPVGRGPIARPLPEPELPWRALVLGLQGEARRQGCGSALLDLAGGPEAMLAAAVAVEAFGAAGVRVVAGESGGDALAARLGLRAERLDTGPAVEALRAALAAVGPPPAGAALEGLAQRVRESALLALAESAGALLVSGGAGRPGFPALGGLGEAGCAALLHWRGLGGTSA